MSKRPLADIVVVDLTRVLAGPFCTMVLHDLGAEIIKVESPGTGDDARHFGPFLDEAQQRSAYFWSLNCGKKSLALDLKTPGGKEILERLIGESDVLIENFRPGALARLGFSETRIRDLNPALVYATASGFGHTGPEAERPAYDMIIQALSGLMSITGTEEGQRVRVGSSIADIVTGLYTAIGIIAALYRRHQIGRGARIDLAMLDSTVSVLENAIARYQVTKQNPGPLGARHPSITPFESFRTKDSEIVIAAGNNRLFEALCSVLGKPTLAHDPRFATNPARTEHFAALRAELEALLKTDTTEQWLQRLEAAQIPCARVNTIGDLFDDPQLAARHMFVNTEGESDFRVVGSPIKFKDEFEITQKGKPPALGEHNAEILREQLGYSEAEIQGFIETGAIWSSKG
jgi:CoA:oxalate CoA-transferase